MGISEFFQAVANNIRNHYLELANQTQYYRATNRYSDADRNIESSPPEADSYEPSADANAMLASQSALPSDKTASAEDERTAVDEPAVEGSDRYPAPDTSQPTYRFQHHTHFNYEVRLQFQLQAIARVAQSIAEGDTGSLEEFAAAGFGLKAAMDFRGKQVTEESEAAAGANEAHEKNALMVKARQATAFAFQSRNFAVESFAREALKVKRSLDVKTGEEFQRTVNKFSLRFRMDHRFSFSFLNRLNVQTEQMAQADPENLDPYVSSAGKVAEGGTTDMMATFFDAVDAYLDQAEEQLLARAEEFFNMAAGELGLSGESVASARGNLVDSITSFFARVESALDGLQAWFAPAGAEPDVTEQSPAAMPPDYVTQNAALAVA